MAGNTRQAADGWPGGEPAVAASGRASERGLAGGEPTGDPRVDAALARLGELDQLPVSEHPAVFADVHQRLEDVLSEAGADAVARARD